MTAKIKTNFGVARHSRSHRPKKISKKTFDKVYWPYIPLVIVITGLFSIGGQAGALQAYIQHRSGNVLAYATSMSVSGLLSATNTQRSQNGVSGLSLNSKLNAAAQAKASDMASRNYWSHNTPEGNPPWVFVTAQGYSYQKLGENLAAGFNDEQSTVNGWMASAAHRENLLDSAFSEVGFGFANNPDYTSAGGGPMTIVVAFYGAPEVLAAQTPSPAPAAPAPESQPAPASASSQPPASEAEPKAKEDKAKLQVNKASPSTTADTVTSDVLTRKTSWVQLALARFKIASWATLGASLLAAAAIGLWASRHVLAVRRVVVRGESFAIHHPLFDIGLLFVAALSYLLTQSAGLIR